MTCPVLQTAQQSAPVSKPKAHAVTKITEHQQNNSASQISHLATIQKTKQLFAHCGANLNHFPQHQVVLIDWGPAPERDTPPEEVGSSVHASCSWALPSCGVGRLTPALDFVQLSLSGPFCCSETAAEAHAAPSKETIRNTLFPLLPTINHQCVELVARPWSKWIVIHALLSRAASAAAAFLC